MHRYRIFDAHCDTLSLLHDTGGSFERNRYCIDARRMRGYMSYTQVFACYTPPQFRSCAYERCLEMIDLFHTSGMSGILSIEGGEPIVSLAALRNFSRLGVRAAGLTWNNSNHLAAGADESDASKGLTDFGRSVVREMNRLGMTIDVSHLNDRSFYEVMSLTDKPVIASHSDSRSICGHRRNLTDEMFMMLVRSGGCVGINFYPPFLHESGKAGISDIICHIEHFMALGGDDYIGIGADFDGTDGDLPEYIRGCEDLYKIFDELCRLGYSDEQIEKISHLNFERIL